MEWNGMEWNEMEWTNGTSDKWMEGGGGGGGGMEWNGMEWNGMEWNIGMEWKEWNGMEGMDWNGRMEWNGTIRTEWNEIQADKQPAAGEAHVFARVPGIITLDLQAYAPATAQVLIGSASQHKQSGTATRCPLGLLGLHGVGG